jgi:hypothetical protein
VAVEEHWGSCSSEEEGVVAAAGSEVLRKGMKGEVQQQGALPWWAVEVEQVAEVG